MYDGVEIAISNAFYLVRNWLNRYLPHTAIRRAGVAVSFALFTLGIAVFDLWSWLVGWKHFSTERSTSMTVLTLLLCFLLGMSLLSLHVASLRKPPRAMVRIVTTASVLLLITPVGIFYGADWRASLLMAIPGLAWFACLTSKPEGAPVLQ